jgi:hypothetical protein
MNAGEEFMMAPEAARGHSSNDRKTVSLGPALEKSLSAYVSAAVAAGVSLLALTKSADAKIIYTAADINIPVSNTKAVLLDLNHDGVVDFSFWNLSLKYGAEAFGTLNVGCAAVPVSSHNSTCRDPKDQIWGKGYASGRFAYALPPGFAVKANKSYFQPGRKRMGSFVGPHGPMADMAGTAIFQFSGQTSSRTSGQWFYTSKRYLGLQFTIGGQVHYGWARVAVTRSNRAIQATLTGYAYETIPNKPIITGKTKGPDVITFGPASLGRLAQGAASVSAWREKRK